MIIKQPVEIKSETLEFIKKVLIASGIFWAIAIVYNFVEVLVLINIVRGL